MKWEPKLPPDLLLSCVYPKAEGLDFLYSKASAQNSPLWRRYHHMYLCAQSQEEDETPLMSEGQGQVLTSVSSPSATSSTPSISITSMDGAHDTTGNHIILIMPFKDHVYELDSHRTAAFCIYLGLAGTDWTVAAQVRLKQWSGAAHLTTVHNDVYAYISDD